jgi:peptidoglycan/xylan/chitin deacetylase (PgdA/CDA1 family)
VLAEVSIFKIQNDKDNQLIIKQLMWTGIIIEQIVGVFPKYVRPPYGAVNTRTLQIINAVGLIPVVWNLVSINALPFNNYDVLKN